MKVKTSVTLSSALVKALDHAARPNESRSQALERILREGLAAANRRQADERDRALIDEHAEALNAEASDVLRYQVDV